MKTFNGTGSFLRAFTLPSAVGMAIAVSLLFCSGCASTQPPHPAPVTVGQILDMNKAGLSAENIIGKIKASGTIYRLKASQLSDLEKQGVPPAVIDYMQQTYLDAVKRDAAYENWNYWTMHDDYWYGGAPYGWPYETIYVIRERGTESRETPQHERLESPAQEQREHGHR